MDTLTELYNQQIVPLDDELEKQAAEMVKQAEEEEFAGRIMARGFADELNKLAAPSFGGGASPIKDMGKGTTIKSKGYGAVGGGGSDTALPSRKGEGQSIMGGRKAKAPGGGGFKPQGGAAKPASGPSMNSPFASKGGGSGLMGSAVGQKKGQRTSAAPQSYANAQGAKPLNMPKPGGAPGAAAGSVVGKMNLGKMPSLASK